MWESGIFGFWQKIMIFERRKSMLQREGVLIDISNEAQRNWFFTEGIKLCPNPVLVDTIISAETGKVTGLCFDVYGSRRQKVIDKARKLADYLPVAEFV